jgi:hypothetical protein
MGVWGVAPPFLTSALDEGDWSASRTCRFTPGETAPGTNWRGGWVDPRAGLGDVEKKYSSCFAGKRISAIQPVARCYADCAIPIN